MPDSSLLPLLAGALALIAVAAIIVCAFLVAAYRRVRRRQRQDAARHEARFAEREAAFIAANARLDAVLRSIDVGVMVLDQDQRITNMSHAAEGMLALTHRQASGRLIQEALRQPELNRCVAAALAGDDQEAEISLLGDTTRRIRVAHQRLVNRQGRLEGLVLILTDLTHLRRLETVRTDFASNVSHELRTPITNIKGYVETLLDPALAADEAQREQFLRIISKNADRLSAIVEDMLMLAQIERPEAKESLAVEHARIAPIIDSVIAALSNEAASRSVSLKPELSDDPWAEVNPPLIEQAISNLVANAVRYSPAGATVRIRARGGADKRPAEPVRIEVIDNGPGIGEEHLGRIFERFYRVEKARGRERGGTGLGLAIVKHIMNLHRGTVEVESELGRGSTFRLLLPTPESRP
ncbi:MAG: PAS domain-containing protein [Phycisphaerae bacterium]|nr:PAS domain-containing protein [Phycisphaerae bacterium]